jgi:hypothetical protein
MSRTISEIYDAIILEKESNPALTVLDPNAGETASALLAELTSNSKVAIWRLIFWIVSVSIWSLENIFDLFKIEILALGETLVTGTSRWYWKKCFEYQHGDVLVWNSTTSRFEYATTNTAIQIIKRSAVVDLTGLVKIKVAKLSSGSPVSLDNTELTAFTYYMNLIKFAGTNIEVISLDADLLRVELTVVIDRLVLLSTGESIANAGTFPVEDSINTYISELPFDGTLSLTALIDAIQKTSGVVNPVLTLATAKPLTGTHLTIDPVNGYNASAGYLAVDPSFPLNTSITYV